MKRSLPVLLAFASAPPRGARQPANAPLPPADIKARLKGMKPGRGTSWY